MKKTHHTASHKKSLAVHIVKAKTFPTHDKSIAWIGVLTLIYVLLVVFTVLAGQYLLAIILVLSAIVYYLVGNLQPRRPTVSFNPAGISFNKRSYPYRFFRWFRLFYTPFGLRLELQPLQRLRLPMGFDLGSHDPSKIFNKLAVEIPWSLHARENFSERLMRWLKL